MKPSEFFPEIQGNFGFGCMRLPMTDGKVDYEEFRKMTDAFIDAGFNYFDTAHGYLNGMSELAIRDCVSQRYDRSRFLLTNKLSDPFFERQEDIRPFVKQQLEWCGVEYFDFYLMHAQDHENYPKYQACRAYETCSELKKEGLIRHLGISFHDKPEVLEMILTDHPEVEIVQIQFNYVDYEDARVQSRAVYEVCEKFQKPVIVMEPVKGGILVNLPEQAKQILQGLGAGSNASYAMRFAASFPQMTMVLSGMSDLEQMQDNLRTMQEFKALSGEEMSAIHQVRELLNSLNTIPCTSCKYCIEENHCPQQILIPRLFSALNEYEIFHSPSTIFVYNHFMTGDGNGKASDCIKCGKCEKVCPQHLKIRDLLEQVARTLEQ
ncbi:MAG: aldo/keto reductase [Parasporobacterium sp.]|nr:aldo/keto reductase [Parasporobacterium sp.]